MSGLSEGTWIAVDWGTTNLRAWLMDGAGRSRGDAGGGKGMNALAPSEFEPELLRIVAPWLVEGECLPVLVCGMAGARQGWLEAPYMDIPAPVDALAGRTVPVATADPRIAPRIVPGICQRDRDRPDVMRGEETQLAGLAALHPGFAGLVCLPGTHGKWVRMTGGVIDGFTTMMGGELFALLEGHSILRHSLDARAGHDPDGFSTGLSAARAHGGRLLGRLFPVRAGDLLLGRSRAWSRSYLSGLLIGSEVVEALGDGVPGGPVMVIGTAALAARYLEALAAVGHSATEVPGEDATLAGLASIYRRLVARNAWTAAA